ncbi:MAG TPA: diguanylate cyclase [Noviherbaspirillum sp.]|nr:diguanylate cyclase [Noviherbaspirillum sp.]
MSDTSRTWHSRDLPRIIHEDDQAHFRRQLHAALKGSDAEGSMFRVELRLRDTMHAWHWVEIAGRVVERDEQARALRMVGTFSDIHDRKEAEYQGMRMRNVYAALSHANQAIVRSRDRTTLFAEICRIAVEHGQFHDAWIGAFDHTGHFIPMASARLCAATAQEHVFAEAALRENKVQVRNCARDIQASLASSSNTGKSTRTRSIASFPLHLSGKPFGALTVHSEHENFFDATLIDLIEEMARNISFAMDNFERETRRKAMEAALSESEKFKTAILTAALDCIVSVNRKGEIISFNQAAESAFGYRSTDVLGKPFSGIIVPAEWHEQIQQDIECFFDTGKSTVLNRRIELTAIHANGTTFPAEVAVVPLSGHSRQAFTAFIRDISEQKRAENLQLGQNSILNMVATGAALRDILAEIAQFAEELSGRGLCSIRQLSQDGTLLYDRVAPSLPQVYIAQIDDACVGPCNHSCGTAVYRGEPVSVTDIASDLLWSQSCELALAYGLKACTSWPIFGKNHKILGSFAFYYRDAVGPSANELQLFEICTRLAGIAIESRASEEKMRYLAHYDGLTSLPNRFLFKEYLELALRNARRNKKKFAVFFLDLDRFKEINDTLGHDAGDYVLREVAKRMRNCLRHTDKIARMGGDEFYALIEDLNDGCHAADVAQKLLDEVSRPLRIDGKDWHLSVSIGIGIFPDDGANAQILLQNADSAMYRAKNRGKNGFQFFSSRKDAEATVLKLFNRRSPLPRCTEKALRVN